MALMESTGMAVETGLRDLAGKIDGEARAIARVERLSGGATQEIWRFDLLGRLGDCLGRYILRRAPGGIRITQGVGLEVEARLMAAAASMGVPVAEVAHVLTAEDGLGHGFVMRFVEGETLGGRIVKADHLRAARRTLAGECGETLAKIHRIPASDFPTLTRATPAELVEGQRLAYRATSIRRPVFDVVLRWLTEHAPSPTAPAVVHGDFRNGNLMIGPDGLRAVLDWELAHIGDPMEDLGWICVNSWRFGRIDLPVGGFGTLEDLLGGYELISGTRLDRAAVHWWQVYGTIRWGIICASSVVAFRGEDATMERAMIARRTSETEIDLLRLIAS